MKKKLIYIFVILLSIFFIISGCKHYVGREIDSISYNEFAVKELENYVSQLEKQGINVNDYLLIRDSTDKKLIKGTIYKIPLEYLKIERIKLNDEYIENEINKLNRELTKEEEKDINQLIYEIDNGIEYYNIVDKIKPEYMNQVINIVGKDNINEGDKTLRLQPCATRWMKNRGMWLEHLEGYSFFGLISHWKVIM